MKEHEPKDLPEKDSPLGWTHDLVGRLKSKERKQARKKEGLQENLSIHSVARCY
jgi:hypothetical protein